MPNQAMPKPWDGLPPELPFIRAKFIPEKTGFSNTQIYELIAAGEFPPMVKIGSRASGVPSNWLKAWLLSRVEASTAAAKRRRIA